MEKTILTILLLAGLYALYLTAEALIARRDRKQLKHVIYVNGTRGKSTVTRMIDAGLRAGGRKVFSKSTGTLPMCLHVDGSISEISRKAPANIREQLRVMHQAVREGAEVLVAEDMALQRELQFVSGQRMLRADIGVITNARLDHTDVMGGTREQILDVLMEMLPKKGRIFTAEADLFAQIEERAARLGSEAVLARPEEAQDFADLDFPENAALALAVCMALGVPREKAAEGIRRFVRDPYDLKVYRNGTLTVINAFSANDVTSTLKIYADVTAGRAERLVLLINNREDRPARAQEMIRLAQELGPQEIWLLGEQLHALERYARRKCPDSRVLTFQTAAQLPLEELAAAGSIDLAAAKTPALDNNNPITVLLAVGNIRNQGIAFSERVEEELELVPRARYGAGMWGEDR